MYEFDTIKRYIEMFDIDDYKSVIIISLLYYYYQQGYLKQFIYQKKS